jgi:spore coat polysaccharide biosynthesis protein SpsF
MTCAIIQARMSSTRLPGKVLKSINGRPMLSYMIERVRAARALEKVILATSQAPDDDVLAEFCRSNNILCFRGDLEDVLDRYYQSASAFNCKHIVRLTSDCPIVDPRVIDNMVGIYHSGGYDYVANTCPPEGFSYPEGMDVEIFSMNGLEKAWRETKKPSEREHVTFYFWQNPEIFSIFRHDLDDDLSHYRLTVDYPEDFEVVSRIISELYPKDPLFSMHDIIDYLEKNPEVKGLNDDIQPFQGWASAFEKDRKANVE